jgi:hypothetical protein
MDMDKFYLCLLNGKYGNWLFRSKAAFYNFQKACKHVNVVNVLGKHHDYRVCERCLKVIDETEAPHHPEIARFHDDGGPPLIEEIDE